MHRPLDAGVFCLYELKKVMSIDLNRVYFAYKPKWNLMDLEWSFKIKIFITLGYNL